MQVVHLSQDKLQVGQVQEASLHRLNQRVAAQVRAQTEMEITSLKRMMQAQHQLLVLITQ